MANVTPPRKTVIYRAALPLHPSDWTLKDIRQFVEDADTQGIPDSTPVRRLPGNDGFAFATDNMYYGLGVERVIELDGRGLKSPSCNNPDWDCCTPKRDATS